MGNSCFGIAILTLTCNVHSFAFSSLYNNKILGTSFIGFLANKITFSVIRYYSTFPVLLTPITITQKSQNNYHKQYKCPALKAILPQACLVKTDLLNSDGVGRSKYI